MTREIRKSLMLASILEKVREMRLRWFRYLERADGGKTSKGLYDASSGRKLRKRMAENLLLHDKKFDLQSVHFFLGGITKTQYYLILYINCKTLKPFVIPCAALLDHFEAQFFFRASIL